MAFSAGVKTEALIRSRRYCCICRKFSGRNTNVHHIVQEADGGSNEIDNAIVLCLNCHGDVGHYNPRHPIGNKYSVEEVRRLRDYWWEWCKTNPFAPGPDDPIKISPASLTVPGGDWNAGDHNVTIFNSSHQTCYAVWLKFVASLGGFDPSDLEFARPKWATNRLGATGVDFLTDCVLLYATDLDNRRSVYACISRVEPHLSLSLDLAVKKKTPTSERQTIPIQLLAWSDAPVNVQYRRGELDFSFEPPEPITILSFLWLNAP